MRNRMAIVAVFAGALALASAVHASTDPPTGGDKSMTLTPIKERVVVMENVSDAEAIGVLIVKKLSALTAVDKSDIVNTKNRPLHAVNEIVLVGKGDVNIISGSGGLLQLEGNKIDDYTFGLARGSPRANDTTTTSGFGSGGGGRGGGMQLTNLDLIGGHHTEKIGDVDRNNGLV